MPENQQPRYLTVNDHNGTPDHVLDLDVVTRDGFTLALQIGASRGDQETITAAINEAITKYPRPGYILAAALTQLGRDLIPAYTELSTEATGIDWHQHCQNMLDNPAPEQEDH